MSKEKKINPRASFDTDYVNEDHIRVFQEALSYDDEPSSTTPLGQMSRSNSFSFLNFHNNSIKPRNSTTLGGVETISSQSDWTPVYNKTKKRNTDTLSRINPSSSGLNLPNISELDKNNFKHEVKLTPIESGDALSIHTSPSEYAPPSTASSHKTNSGTGSVEESSLTFTILRYPLLTLIMLWMSFLSILYFIVRISIAFSEKMLLSRDKKRSELVNKLRNSSNYQEYIENSKKLDKYLKLDEWCNEDKYKYYDWRNLKRTINNLRKLRHAKKYEDLMVVLQTCLKSNFAGTENPLMYSHCYYGTKKIIEKYNTEVVKCLDLIITTDEVNIREKRIFFKIVNKNFGRTCLVLSGGASFCYNHFGVLKALIENDCMPKIISGTSGGGMIAALAATRHNNELLELIKPKLACKINAFDNEPMWKWIKRWWKTGARFDSVDWARRGQWWTTGSKTFDESYKETGKILNISTVPNDIHSPTILCNYITSPNCCIWSAMLASAAVPGILNPVILMEKTKDDSVRPFSLGSKWKDGSLRTDIPLSTLNMYFNTKFSIVSQVNPHVMLWIFKNRGDIGKPIIRSKGKTFRGGFILSYLENLIKLEIIKWLKLVKEFQLFPNLLESDWSNLFLQNFGGTITLFPKIVLSDYMYILSDPTEERLERIIKNGESVTYPKILFIKHRLNIERTIERGLDQSKVNIDSTFKAPPDLVKNIIDNDEMVDKETYPSDDDNNIYINESNYKFESDDQEQDNRNGKGKQKEDLEVDPLFEINDTSAGANNSSRKSNLGFLGIPMGSVQDTVASEESYEDYDSHDDSPLTSE